MKKAIFLCSLLITGCSPIKYNYDYLNDNSLTTLPTHLPTVVNIPESSNLASWGRPVTGELLLKKLGRHPEKASDESKAEYQARIPDVDGLSFTSVGFKVFDYDPDTEKLSFSGTDPDNLGSGFESYSESKNFDDVGQYFGLGMIGGGSVDVGSYEASNAFGVTAVVNKTKSTGFQVVFGKKMSMQLVRMDFDGDCKISPHEYRKVKNNLAIEYIAKLIYPYIYKAYSGTAPTIDSPYQDSGYVYYFRTELLAARLIDFKSHKIYPCKMKYEISQN
ncbi:hypothetical protein [Tatumella terrea]|uniref:Lipoprotein n=1 Tax=Tatumella terrea TaxID=419007 RepID=A0ABW1VY42_9GAMM